MFYPKTFITAAFVYLDGADYVKTDHQEELQEDWADTFGYNSRRYVEPHLDVRSFYVSDPDPEVIEFLNRDTTVVIVIYPDCFLESYKLHDYIETNITNHRLSIDDYKSMKGKAKKVYLKKYDDESKLNKPKTLVESNLIYDTIPEIQLGLSPEHLDK